MKNNTTCKLRFSFGIFFIFSILPISAQVDEVDTINENLKESVQFIDSIQILKEWEASIRWEDSIKNVLYPDLKIDTIPVSKRLNQKPTSKTTLASTTNKSLNLIGGVRNASVPTTISIDKSKSVGEIPITSTVTPSGAVSYSVPIEVFSGVNGVQPQLSIAYNSQSGNGPLGVGWYISGLSSIRRVDKSIYYDDNARNIQLSYSDAFSLDGVRLIRVSDLSPYIYNGFVDTIDYVSEQGNIKVKAYIYEDVVKYFTVSYPNGQTSTYGYSTNSSSKLDYPLTQMSDLFGNSITYNYTETNNQYRMSSVEYGAASVVFQYVNRLDTVVSFKTGFKIIEDQILEQISCKFNGNTLRNYNLSYTKRNSESFLSTIGYAAPDGTQLNPLQFLYGENNTATVYSSVSTNLLYYYAFTDPSLIKVIRGNFVYDTQDDGLIALPAKNPYWKHYREPNWFQNSQNSFDNTYSGSEVIILNTNVGEDYGFARQLTTGVGFIDIFCANVDGELGEEVVMVNNVVSGEDDQVTFKVYQGNCYTGLGLKYTRTFNFPTVLTDLHDSKMTSVQPKYYYPGDYNGDGKTEILVVSCNMPFGWAAYPTNCYLIDLESDSILYSGQIFTYNVSFVGSEQMDPTVAYNNTDRLLAMDYNGDGKTDICLINEHGTYVYTINNTGSVYSFSTLVNGYTELKRSDLADKLLLPGELNGDGNTDFLVSPLINSNNWYAYNSKGRGSFEKSILVNPINRGSTAKYLLQDVNTDGISDIIEHIEGNSTSDIFKTYLIRNMSISFESNTTIPTNSSVLIPININSRGFSQQILSLRDRVVTLFSYPRNDSKEKLLTGMVTSLGVVNKNYYNTLIESSSFYQGNGADYPYENYQGSYIITEEQEQFIDGILNESLSYSYNNAIVHKQGLGFRGFTSMYTYDNIRNRNYIKRFDPLNFCVPTEEESPTSKKTYNYYFDVAPNKIAKVNLQSLVEKDKLNSTTGSPSLTTSTYTYDTYGNPLTATMDYGGGITETVSNTYVNNLNETGYLLGFLTDQTTTKSRNGQSVTTRTYIPTYTNGLPLKKYQYINGTQVLEQDFTYNNKGCLTQKSEKAYSSVNALTTSCVYDDAGRVTHETDALGLFTDYEYNPINGTVSIVRNHKGQPTTFGYDSFLRKTSTQSPDGTTSTTALEWNTPGSSGLFYCLTTPQGEPWTKTYYDALGRVVATSTRNINLLEPRIEKEYDSYGRLYRESLPFTGSTPLYWKTYQYDNYDRQSSIVEATGSTITYTYGVRSVTTTQNGVGKTKTVDTQGNTINIVDPAGTITYNLRPDGQPSSIVAPGNITTSFTYDNIGRRLTISDPSAGTQTYVYNNDGNLDNETDAKGQVISYTYDMFNRLTGKTQPEFTTAYNYNADGLLASVISNNGTSKMYTYDEYLRLYKEKEMVVDGKWLEKTYTLSGGQLTSTQYTSQSGPITTENYYYRYGHLREVKLNGSTSIWRLDSVNALGQPTKALTGGYTRRYGYNTLGYPTTRTASTFQQLSYEYDVAKGNLNNKTENTYQENYTYDNLDRLTGFGSGNTAQYDSLGNLLGRSDIGTFTYGNASAPYRITAASTVNSSIPMRDRTTLYNSLNRPSNIGEGEYSALFVYNADGDRVKMGLLKNDTTIMNRYYVSDCYEIDEKSTGTVKQKLYLNGDFYTANAVMIKNNSNSWGVYYICRDNQGSITHVTSRTGSVLQELSYDAWGRLRDPITKVVYAPGSEPELLLGRGYCGHEHLAQFGLINMNARLYDPAIGRFLSPDPYIQAPDYSQNFNRYSYCLNNPLKYTDPTGDFLVFDAWIAGFLSGGFVEANKRASNDIAIWKGVFTFDTSKPFWGHQVVSRFIREELQTDIGLSYSLLRNFFGCVDRVEYFDGATYVINENSNNQNGVTLGNYININNIKENRITGDFTQYVLKHPMYMHEYGHYIQSQNLGLFYLFAVGIPSLCSATEAKYFDTTIKLWKGKYVWNPDWIIKHDIRWYELSANKRAKGYFEKKYGIIWGEGEMYNHYLTSNPFED